jgi:hypothetical protein
MHAVITIILNTHIYECVYLLRIRNINIIILIMINKITRSYLVNFSKERNKVLQYCKTNITIQYFKLHIKSSNTTVL